MLRNTQGEIPDPVLSNAVAEFFCNIQPTTTEMVETKLLLVTPPDTFKPTIDISLEASKDGLLKIYEGVGMNMTGTEIGSYNLDRTSDVLPSTKFYDGPDVTATEPMIIYQEELISNGRLGTKSIKRLTLKPDTNYMVSFVPYLDDTVRKFRFDFEEEDLTPLP